MRKILIVDDRENTGKAIALCLQLNGYRTAQALRGRKALEMLDGGDVDLVLMDVIMPEMCGPEAAARIREKNAGIPVIFMSSYGRTGTESDVFPGPFLPKPFQVKDLLEEIERQLAPAGVVTS